MATENTVLLKEAKDSLSGKWPIAIGVFIVTAVMQSLLPSLLGESLGSVISMVITGPLALGVALFYMSISRGQDADFNQVFSGFNRFVPTLITFLLFFVVVIIGCILLIVPGIMASLGLSMTFFIMNDDPNISGIDALKKSWSMMDGYKMKLFLLILIFLGLGILCILTLGIGFLFLVPLMNTTMAKFYDDINGNLQDIDEIGDYSTNDLV